MGGRFASPTAKAMGHPPSLPGGAALSPLDLRLPWTPTLAIGDRTVVLRRAYVALRHLHVVSLCSMSRLALALARGLRDPLPTFRRPTSSHPFDVGIGITDKKPV